VETAAALLEPSGQGWVQVVDLLVAFALSSVIGLERQLRGKPAGLRTQAIVGTASALFLLVSKFGFGDVAGPGTSIDPSRVAAQIVSGVGFLGAGLIITRRGAIRGLTTAAAVWETAAIGMAAGAGLPVLAGVVTGLHFVVVVGYTRLARRLPSAGDGTVRLRVAYADRQGVLRTMLAECARRGWVVTDLAVDDAEHPAGVAALLGDGENGEGGDRPVVVTLALGGPDVATAAGVLGGTPGVLGVQRAEDDTE
jgi:putative Mg2+ transporter-C (MgtC) family protein